MPAKCWIVAVVGATLSMLFGCQRERSGDRLAEIARRQGEQQKAITRIVGRIEGVEKTLYEIQRSVAPASGAPGKPDEKRAARFEDTPEYNKILTALSDIEEQLTVTQQELAKLEQTRVVRERWAELKLNPMGLNRTLRDAYVFLFEEMARKTEDRARWKAFEEEAEELGRTLRQSVHTQKSCFLQLIELAKKHNIPVEWEIPPEEILLEQ